MGGSYVQFKFRGCLAANALNSDQLSTALKHLQEADKIYRSLRQTSIDGDELQRYIQENNARMKAVSDALNP